MEVKAHLKHLRISPRKVRLVANLIKGMDVKRAELELRHVVKRSASPLLKLLKSAVANAKHNFQFDEDSFYIKQILVNQGPTTKRFRARAFGRAAPIRKRTNHISLIIDTRTGPGLEPKRKKKEGPVVREIAEVKIKGESEKRPRTEKTPKAPEKEALRPKETGFVKRMFRRKAI